MPMPMWRGWLITKLGGRGSTSISVGSHVMANGHRDVSLSVMDGWQKTGVRLTPEGARRIARQIIEWADSADKLNAENGTNEIITKWRYVANYAAKDLAETTEAPKDAPKDIAMTATETAKSE